MLFTLNWPAYIDHSFGMTKELGGSHYTGLTLAHFSSTPSFSSGKGKSSPTGIGLQLIVCISESFVPLSAPHEG